MKRKPTKGGAGDAEGDSAAPAAADEPSINYDNFDDDYNSAYEDDNDETSSEGKATSAHQPHQLALLCSSATVTCKKLFYRSLAYSR